MQLVTATLGGEEGEKANTCSLLDFHYFMSKYHVQVGPCRAKFCSGGGGEGGGVGGCKMGQLCYFLFLTLLPKG